jgi:hypothetical protein
MRKQRVRVYTLCTHTPKQTNNDVQYISDKQNRSCIRHFR